MTNQTLTPAIKYPNQRVGVFVDVQNLYYSAKALYKAKVNFREILKTAASDRELIRAFAYVIKADVVEEKNFFDALLKIGYEVRAKDLQTFYGGNKKGDWDVGIAMDIMRLASKLDVIVLASGDGDFKDLLVHAKALGCKTEVVAFKKSSSASLLEVADDFINLEEGSKYIIRGRAPIRNHVPRKTA
ncbi:NYN domain-containing protein [Patescibacteria group bacterium]|nr:NYN domain-containing protein [Patescibacteria group bacterium]